MSDKYISSEDIKKAKKHFIDKISKAKKVGEILEAKEEYQEFGQAPIFWYSK
jgi:hypothetical protein